MGPIHPASFIQDELDARGWSLADLANQMGMERCARNKLELDMYFLIGPTDTRMRMGSEMIQNLGRAFDISPAFFANLEHRWLADIGGHPMTAPRPDPQCLTVKGET